MKKLSCILAIIMLTMSTGCMTYRHRNAILDEESLKTAVEDKAEKYRLVEFRLSGNLDAAMVAGREQVVDGKAFTEWLATEYPAVFSASGAAIPLIVRQKVKAPPEIEKFVAESQEPSQRGLDYGLHPSVFDIIFTQITLGLWPATISYDYEFETAIQISDETYAEPFSWKTRYTDHVANTAVAYMYYPSSRGYTTGSTENTMKKVRTLQQLQRTMISKKSTEAEKQAAKTEIMWYWGGQNEPEVVKRGTALGIIGALNRLTPEQKQTVRDNPVARYLADKADGKAGVEASSTSEE